MPTRVGLLLLLFAASSTALLLRGPLPSSPLAMPTANSAAVARSVLSMMARDDEEEWKPPAVFSKENAAPWAIIFVTVVFQGLSTLPRESLPDFIQTAIPLVLGEQYAPR